MLSLRVNKITGQLPTEWDTPSLTWLLLSDNQLTGGMGRRVLCGGWCDGGAHQYSAPGLEALVTTGDWVIAHPYRCFAVQSSPGHTLSYGAPGTVPPSLAQQPRLGTLRLEGNRLGGSLDSFAGALPSNSQMFHFDVSRNDIGGALPNGLQRLGAFSPDQQFVMLTPAGQVSHTDAGEAAGSSKRFAKAFVLPLSPLFR